MAPTDNQNPTDQTINGSTSASARTATASSRTGDRSRPVMNAVADSTAIAPARRIEGSNRVRATNHTISATVTTQRGRGRSRTRIGPQAASRKLTFCPETAVRCDRPLARKRSIMSIG